MSQPILSVLRGFSAPVQLELNEPGDYDLQGLCLMMIHLLFGIVRVEFGLLSYDGSYHKTRDGC